MEVRKRVAVKTIADRTSGEKPGHYDSRGLAVTQSVEEMFCFIEVTMPYLCGLWRFANAWIFILGKGEGNHEQLYL